jgi:alkylation response protein AidB-like acyl-CoA dehydrogenase
MTASSHSQWIDLAHKLGKDFRERAPEHDRNDSFVQENYADLKKHRFFAAAIPEDLGGGGASHMEMSDILRTIAQYCSSTALAMSMHQHLLAANIWKYKRGDGGEDVLKKVADSQVVLVSTGARDWLESNGEMQKTKGGYLVSAAKHFASQSATGDVLVTSAPYEHPERGWQVLHFPVPFKSGGLTVLNNWKAMGMRGTGSHTVKLEKVFVPEAAISLERERGEFHPFWNVVVTVAMPLIMSVYVGIAERAAQMAFEQARGNKNPKPHVTYSIAEMNNDLITAQVILQDMLRITDNYNFQPIDQNSQDILARKTVLANTCVKVVTKAMEIVGGPGFFRSFGMERLFRDVQAAKYHPLQEKDQLAFSGEFLLRR